MPLTPHGMIVLAEHEALLAEIARLRAEVAALEATMIHPKAVVHDDCTIAPSVRIWQFASILRHSRIGPGTVVGACAIIDACNIGANCRIGSHACLNPGTFLEDNVFIGPHAVTCNDPWPGVDRGDLDLEGLLAGSRVCIHIARGASIGASAVILPGVAIGAEAMIAAGSVVQCSVPASHLHKRSGEIVPIEPQILQRAVNAQYRDNAVGP